MTRNSRFNRSLAAGVLAVIAGTGLSIASAEAGTLENLMRERAVFVDALLDPSLTPSARQGAIQVSQNRLVDLERMVIRDDSLLGRNTPTVRRAFNKYDLTFLVHSSVEKDISIVDNWLDQIGISTADLMSAKRGRR